MTVYQKDGGDGFIGYDDREQEKPEELITEDKDENCKSSHLRAKWFLSTNQWQGFIPLQIPALESLSIEKNKETDNRTCSEDVTELSEMSSTMSESLEKMKENHSLFYKIACDISISDSDIKSDDQTSSRPEEEEVLVNKETVRTVDVRVPSDQESNVPRRHSSLAESGEVADNTSMELSSEKQDKMLVDLESCPAEKLGQEDQAKVLEIGDCVQERDFDQTMDGHPKTKEKRSVMKESEALKVNQYSGVRQEDKIDEEDPVNGNSISVSNTEYDDGRIIRSASFGKPRVTVLRTSL